MSNETQHVPVAKRGRENKVKFPETKEDNKEQDARQKAQAKLILQQQESEDARNRALAKKAASAEHESAAFGVLSGRASEIPIIRRGRRSRQTAADLEQDAQPRRRRKNKADA